jgi:hypothetical protein
MMERVGEFADSYPNLDFGYVIVSPKLLAEMLKELHSSYRYQQSHANGFESLALQTHHGQLYVKTESDLEDDDFILLDRSGNRYSYKHFFINQQMEKILLKGETP